MTLGFYPRLFCTIFGVPVLYANLISGKRVIHSRAMIECFVLILLFKGFVYAYLLSVLPGRNRVL